jgi:hypothetical protein
MATRQRKDGKRQSACGWQRHLQRRPAWLDGQLPDDGGSRGGAEQAGTRHGHHGQAHSPHNAKASLHNRKKDDISHLVTLVKVVNGDEELQHRTVKRSGSGILPNRWWSTKQYELSQHTGDSSSNFTMSRASMAAEALRSSGFTASASLRSSSGFVGRRRPHLPRPLLFFFTNGGVQDGPHGASGWWLRVLGVLRSRPPR